MQTPTLADVGVGAAARGITVDQMLRYAMKKDVAGTVGGGSREWRRAQPTPSRLVKDQAWAQAADRAAPRGQRRDPNEPEDDRRARRLAKRLCQAARNGDAEQISTLLDDGAPVDRAGFGGNTALMVAAWNDRADCVVQLLERGATVDLGEPDYGYTPLILAAQYGALSAAQLLVMAGAELHCRLTGGPDSGLTARTLALGGSTRVYADPQPGRAVRASHSRDRKIGGGRIDSQHSSVAELLGRAERARVSARQRLAFAKIFLDEEQQKEATVAQGLAQLLPRNADGGCDLIWCGEGEEEGSSVASCCQGVVGWLDALVQSQQVLDATLSERHPTTAA